jgi:adapter protein MecA 1/2
MSDHTLSLTFSEHPGSDEMMEHLKDIVNGLINSIPQQKWEEMQDSRRTENGGEDVRVLITLAFSEMDVLLRFVRQINLTQLPPSALYKLKGGYMLLLNLSQLSEEEVKCLSVLTDEYVSDIQVGAERMSYIEEHGEVILAENALEMLREI